ncbi:hypothetical protein C7S18_12245 [Ahniella affigens]|uniref:Uncharacterized protein n=1 Tax=Ahniella affigens TaxID=2021234 RepID=A0A2P1PSX5_9GAMM|nr:hypothetical protein [Ahniella affigens]AVP97922.1 hypothetical protein C7S18_12245 [Ahniella affigens]
MRESGRALMYQARIDYVGTDGNVAGLPVKETFELFEDASMTMPLDLTGFTARFALRSRDENGVLLIEATTANGGVVLGGTAGTVAIQTGAMTPAHGSVPAGTHAYALEVFDGSGTLLYSAIGKREFRVRV